MNPVVHDARDLLVAELQSIQRCILPVAIEQLLVSTRFDNTAGIKNDDAVGPFHRRQSMRDNQRRPVLHQFTERFLYSTF